MFGPAGVAYVYLVYGMYDCLNVVTGPDGDASALLIRAVAPLAGMDRMRADRAAWYARRRRASSSAIELERERLQRLPDDVLASGPGLVGAAFGLDRDWTGTDLIDPTSRLRIEGTLGSVPARRIASGPRIGVAYAGEPWVSLPWRLAIVDEPAVSRPRPGR
jgi:DNA-3-methyladenine glycosylase